MSLPIVVLKEGRERSVINRHPWIFSGGIERYPECPDGSFVQLHSSSGKILGGGYLNRKSQLTVRLINFDAKHPKDALVENFRSAVLLRESLVSRNTNAYRVVNSEGDHIPGLIVDRYADSCVIQIGTLGLEMQRELVLELLQSTLSPQGVYEKSALASRREEGLEPVEKLLSGEVPERCKVTENGVNFVVDIIGGQKTGFFLDQREMRALVGSFSVGKRVLNCFCYTGGFSVFAAQAGALAVTSVDSSKDSVERARENFTVNNLSSDAYEFLEADVFEYLPREQRKFDVVILDPPAFAKKRANIDAALRGYLEINKSGLKRVAPGGILMTSSCSYYIDTENFERTIFKAARELRRPVRILQRHRMALDHPVSLFHPEGNYLKSVVLEVG